MNSISNNNTANFSNKHYNINTQSNSTNMVGNNFNKPEMVSVESLDLSEFAEIDNNHLNVNETNIELKQLEEKIQNGEAYVDHYHATVIDWDENGVPTKYEYDVYDKEGNKIDTIVVRQEMKNRSFYSLIDENGVEVGMGNYMMTEVNDPRLNNEEQKAESVGGLAYQMAQGIAQGTQMFQEVEVKKELAELEEKIKNGEAYIDIASGQNIEEGVPNVINAKKEYDVYDKEGNKIGTIVAKRVYGGTYDALIDENGNEVGKIQTNPMLNNVNENGEQDKPPINSDELMINGEQFELPPIEHIHK